MNTLKKYSVAIVTVVALGTYAIWSGRSGSNQIEIVSSGSLPAAENTASGTVAAATPSSAVVVPVAGKYKDGTYTGVVADAFYGNLQVAAIIQNGKLTDVQFLQYPSDRGTSVMINSRSSPILRQEAIQAQSAQVDTVSGATQSSEAFKQSLASALAQA